jgi:hypothetical protein
MRLSENQALALRASLVVSPAVVKEMDEIIVLHGSKLPVVLRRILSKRHRTVGQCYWHGCMNGKKVDWPETEGEGRHSPFQATIPIGRDVQTNSTISGDSLSPGVQGVKQCRDHFLQQVSSSLVFSLCTLRSRSHHCTRLAIEMHVRGMPIVVESSTARLACGSADIKIAL